MLKRLNVSVAQGGLMEDITNTIPEPTTPPKPWNFTSWLDHIRAFLLPARVSAHRKCRHHSKKHNQKKLRAAHRAMMRDKCA
jgi:hypothetical protein